VSLNNLHKKRNAQFLEMSNGEFIVCTSEQVLRS
jgi:hypothetical protein